MNATHRLRIFDSVSDSKILIKQNKIHGENCRKELLQKNHQAATIDHEDTFNKKKALQQEEKKLLPKGNKSEGV